ncbi:MAG TPA: hypothetical protein VGM14_12905 [Streptosporangiaceae bacterium]|jgi:hypothetical protein
MHREDCRAADPITHIFEAWDAALGARDLDASMAPPPSYSSISLQLERQLLDQVGF